MLYLAILHDITFMFVAMADLLPNIVAVMDVSRAECSSGAHICSDATIISHSKLVICQRTVSMFCVCCSL